MKHKGKDVTWADLTPEEKDMINAARELAYRQRQLQKLGNLLGEKLPEDHYLIDLTGSVHAIDNIQFVSIDIGKHAHVSTTWNMEWASENFDDLLDVVYKWLQETFDIPANMM